jgi:hypothetical protein
MPIFGRSRRDIACMGAALKWRSEQFSPYE